MYMVKLKHSNGFLQELFRSLHITSKVRQVGFLSQSDENHNILLVDESFNSVSKRFHFIEIVHQIYIELFKIRFDTGEQLIRSSGTLIMAAILFLIHVTDISSNISSTLRMFADDTKVYRE